MRLHVSHIHSDMHSLSLLGTHTHRDPYSLCLLVTILTVTHARYVTLTQYDDTAAMTARMPASIQTCVTAIMMHNTVCMAHVTHSRHMHVTNAALNLCQGENYISHTGLPGQAGRGALA